MIVKNLIVIIFDIEIFPNVFTLTAKDTESQKVLVIEVSPRKNNLDKLYKLFRLNKYIFCGYNNIHYDNPIVNYLFENEIEFLNLPAADICFKLFQLSKTIITSENSNSWRKWKYGTKFPTFDLLTMLFSQKLRVGLKEMQVTMQYHNVQEYDGDFDNNLLVTEIDKCLVYNLNDVESTEELLNRCEKDIRLREGIEKEFGINVLSKDGMTIGTEILKIKYLEKSGRRWEDIKDLRTPCDEIDLSKVIFPFIEFKTPILQDLLKELKGLKIGAGRKAYEKQFLLQESLITFSVGGIHTKNEPEAIIPKNDEFLLDSDVASLYPSLIVKYGLVPPHLGEEFLDIYDEIRLDRLEAKRNGDKVKNMTYKLALNGATGNYQNEYSWMYSPFTVLQIRINGQLLLLMLTEMLIEAGATVKQLNTDGILYLIPKSVNYQEILSKWEQITKLTLETEEYEAFYQYAINDYVAVGKGYSETNDKSLLKYKGLFIPTISLGKGMRPPIIAKAINNFLVDKIPIEETIRNSKDINDFLTYQKVGKQFQVEYKDKLITHINRYYISNSANAGYLYKCKVDKDGHRSNYNNMLKDSGVILLNDLSQLKEFPKDINYQYYINEVKKIINPFVYIQLSLF